MFLGLESNVSVRARLNPFTSQLFVADTLLNEARPRVSRTIVIGATPRAEFCHVT